MVVKAMILAAGFGTRLAPLTDALPKALIPVSGRPMIDHVIHALRAAGVSEIVVNAHHHADLVSEHFRRAEYGIGITVVVEEEILGTGGGILHARRFLDDGEAFLVHNADIVSTFDLEQLIRHHGESDAFATLAIQRRPTSRAVMFDGGLNFLGKEVWAGEGMTFPHDAGRYSFCGIHVISPAIFGLGIPEGFSDIFDVYRQALRSGKRILGLPCEGSCHDLGSVEKIRAFSLAQTPPPSSLHR